MDFYEYATKLIESRNVDTMYYKKIESSTIYQQKIYLNAIKKLYPTLPLHSITKELVWELRTKLLNKPYKPATTVNILGLFSQILSDMETQMVIEKNQAKMLSLNVQIEKKQIIALNEQELNELITVFRTKLLGKGHEALRQYLIACFTGLRISDILRLKKEHIQNGILKITAKKNGKLIEFPLSNFALKIIFMYEYDGFFFNRINGYNVMLKRVIKKHTKISKHITMHTGRKTFATMFLNHNPGQLDLLATLIGDTPAMVYSTYAEYLDPVKRKTLSFFNQFG